MADELNRAAPIAAQLDAELPPPAGYATINEDYQRVWIAEQMRNFVAPYAERIRLLEQDNGLLSLIADQFKVRLAAADAHIERLEAAERQAKQPVQSIGDDPKFHELLEEYDDAVSVIQTGHARKALIAYIDGRTAAPAPELRQAAQALIAAFDDPKCSIASVNNYVRDLERALGRTAGTASDAAPPVAPKGPFADYSAEEVEAYAREYAESRRK